MNKYTREEVLKLTLEYFKGDELAANVWINKYCLKDSEGNLYERTPDDMHWRIAHELHRIEQKYENPISLDEIYETLKNFKYLVPQGSPMSGIGNDIQVSSISNCFVVGNDSDSYGGIFLTDQEQAQLMKRRGGVGHDLSHVRPKGSKVNNSALSSTGVVPFMERYSNTTREVAQDGRRGALMLSLSIKHPDAEDFIDAKLEQGKVTGANISVKIDDEFMNSVVNNTKYIQQYPINSNEPKVIKEIESKKLWNKIIHNAWKSAEPGILFWDTVMRESVPDCYADLGYKTISTNPCVSEDTLILTDNGYEKIVNLVDKKVNVWNGIEFSEVVPKITGYNQKMLKIKFSDGNELKCTNYHGFYTWEGYERDGKLIKKDAKDLKIGDKLEKYDFPILKQKNGSTNIIINENETFTNDNFYYSLGFFVGDGTLNNDKPYIQLYGEKRLLLNKFTILSNISENNELERISFFVKLPSICDAIGYNNIKKFVPKINDSLYNSTQENTLSWLAGIIDSDGSRNSEEGSISISSIDREFLMDIKLHILNIFGVNGSVIDEKEGGLKNIKGAEYETSKSYRLIISAYNVKKLFDLGLRTFRVKIDDVNPNRDASRFVTIEEIVEIEDAEKVYCFTEKKRNRGCFNGVVTAQCGEITLCPYDSCRLLAINLYSYVIEPFTPNAKFNYELFKKHVQIAQRYMDDIVDLEIEKIDKILEKIELDPEDEYVKNIERTLWLNIKDKTVRGRRTGLGITAEGDMLAALGLRYGTKEATNFSTNIHKILAIEAYKSSCNMAKERGSFEIYNYDREINNPFINRLIKECPELEILLKKYGRRNIALLTCAPTGTVSLMTQTTSGIEPVFLPVYKRRRKVNPNDKDVKVSFIDEVGDSWEEYYVFHHKFITWLEVNNYDVENVKNSTDEEIQKIVEKSPYYKATSNDVDWVEKIRLQGEVQKYIDHSISVTVNLPENVTEDVVSKIYEEGWKVGCKGVTIYREGSRSGVLISTKDKKKKEEPKIENLFKEHNAPKRPEILECDILRFSNKGEKWIGFVGLLEGVPYEIFTGKAEDITIPSYIEKGKIKKVKNGDIDGGSRYDLHIIDKSNHEIKIEALNRTFNDEYWNTAIMISAVLRHGMPIEYVIKLVESLKMEDHVVSWKFGVKKILKKYIKETSNPNDKKCPSCGQLTYIFENGCAICKSCGYSEKCS